MEDWVIEDDGGRKVRFTGELLGSASTEERDSIRWTETKIWRTKNTGKYILQKVGRTKVFHAVHGCKYGTPARIDVQNTTFVPCPVCKPVWMLNTAVKLENDRFSVHISETADGIVESAKLQDDDGVIYTPRVSQQALEQAARKDAAIHEAYMVTVVD